MSGHVGLGSVPLPLITNGVRAFFAPVDRVTGSPTVFDPAQQVDWDCDSPPKPWIELGHVDHLQRTSTTKINPVETGQPSTTKLQVRTIVGSTVSLRFVNWSKLAMALAGGSEHMNVLAAKVPGGTAIGSGAKASPGSAVLGTSSAVSLYVADFAPLGLQIGDLVVVDADYTGQTGFVGAAVSGAYVKQAGLVGNDVDYIRRVSFNVGRVAAVGADGAIELTRALLAGVPTPGMKLQKVVSFVDREGGSFMQEWSALFVMSGVQGERLFVHYPRLQAMHGPQESFAVLAPPLEIASLEASFLSLPVVDGNDGETVVCYRSFVPAKSAYV